MAFAEKFQKGSAICALFVFLWLELEDFCTDRNGRCHYHFDIADDRGGYGDFYLVDTMRLTLRTLLAYRDGVLDPKDAAVLEAKIMDSSTAQQISQRITDEMKNRKLAPIPVDAREFGFEANMVAEFLDDTIPMETLPEMERKCLENNTLLSEIGSCHQILSRALSIPAPISSALRQRIHDLPNNPTARSFSDAGGRIRRFDAGTASTKSASQNGADSLRPSIAIPANKTVRKSNGELRGSGIELNDGLGRQVPEYLIGNDRGWLKTAMLGLVLLTSLVVVGAIAIGPLDRVRNLLRKSDLAKVMPEENAVETLTKEKEKAAKLPPQMEKAAVDSETAEKNLDIVESSVGPPVPIPPSPSVSDKLKPNLADASKSTKPMVSESSATPPVLVANNRIQWLPETKESSEMIVLKLGAAASGAPFWQRMHAGEYVAVGERIVVPPTQRTEMRVEPGIRFLCAGENDFEQSKGGAITSVTIRSGLFFLFATPDAKEINLDCNGLVLTVRFASTDGGCALEIQNEWSSSTDEMAKAGMLASSSVVRLIGVKGEIEYSTKEVVGESKGTLSVGQVTRWKDKKSSGVSELAEEPWWFRTSVTRPIDQLASKALQRAIVGREPGVIESELKEHMSPLRVYELTVSLAVRTRIMLGRYDGLFESEGVFNRGNLHIHWASLFSQAAQSMGRDENRLALADAIRQAAPDRASTLFSLLVLPTQEQLAAGSDKLLVDSLSSPQMDERVIAFQQLNQITGKTLTYHPDKNPGAQLWRKLLAKNEVRYPEPSKP